jgi:hypothetical protein
VGCLTQRYAKRHGRLWPPRLMALPGWRENMFLKLSHSIISEHRFPNTVLEHGFKGFSWGVGLTSGRSQFQGFPNTAGTLVKTLRKIFGWLLQNFTLKTRPEIGGRNSAKMADFSAISTNSVSLYVPLRKTTRSVSETYGAQEGTAYNGHFGCTCYHPLFVFNHFGDLERCALRPGNVHSADGWREVLEPVIARYRNKQQAESPLFPGRRRLRQPRDLRTAGSRGLQIHHPPARQFGVAAEHHLAAEAPGGPTATRGAPVLRQPQLSSRLLDQTAPRGGEGRVAP